MIKKIVFILLGCVIIGFIAAALWWVNLKEKGAEVIALACTGLATIGIARELEEATGLPVIDPVLAEGRFAYFESVRR